MTYELKYLSGKCYISYVFAVWCHWRIKLKMMTSEESDSISTVPSDGQPEDMSGI